MSKKILIWLMVAIFLTTVSPASAQQPTKVTPIGYLATPSRSTIADRMEAFRQGLRELGYVDGKNIVIEWRSADGKLDRLPALAGELVRIKVEVIVTGGGPATRAAKEATSTIPIVMANDNDPVGDGFIASLARPGGNITGLSNFAPELSGKRLEILREVVPKLSRVAVLGTSTTPAHAQMIREIELAAKAFGVKLQYLDVLESKDMETAFRAASKGRADAVLTLPSGILVSQRSQIVELAGLMFYGVNLLDLDRRAATYVDKILKGRTPADLPVEQLMKFEFIINLKAAKKIGVTVPLQRFSQSRQSNQIGVRREA